MSACASAASATTAAAAAAAAAAELGLGLLREWLHTDVPHGVIDARPSVEFVAERIDGTTNFPADEISTRFHELPPPHGAVKLGLIGGDAELLAQLTRRGYVIRFAVAWAAALSMASHDAPKRVLTHVAVTPAALRRLWTPSPCLAGLIESVESICAKARVAIDLGCGVGRDCVFLAQRGWSVVAIDHLSKATSKCVDLAGRHLVSDRVTTLEIDLTAPGCAESDVLAPLIASAGLIHLARFMHRGLIADLLRVAPPGCCIIVHPFCEGAQHVGPCRPKKAEFLLQPGELQLRAHELGWEVLRDEERPIDDGRPLSWFLAVRRHVIPPPLSSAQWCPVDAAVRVSSSVLECPR